MFDGVAKTWKRCSWNPKCLKENDCVGAEMSTSGRFSIYVNGQRVFQYDMPIKDGMPVLYGVVDLIGNTSAIELAQRPAFGRTEFFPTKVSVTDSDKSTSTDSGQSSPSLSPQGDRRGRLLSPPRA